jgi:uncharacterized protein YndB with AHSA1/START domain
MTAATGKFVYVTFIASTPEKVFEAITRPDIARRYWAHGNVSDWKPGSRWEHVSGEGETKVAGNVIQCDPPHRLVMSWASPSSFADAASHSRVTMEITPYEGMVRLTVTHDELEPGGSMEAGISKGWPIVLSSLKSYLETGSALDVFAKPAHVVAA